VLYATNEAMLAEAKGLLRQAITIDALAPAKPPLVARIFTRENAEAYLRDAVR